jgi:hypothetical protein
VGFAVVVTWKSITLSVPATKPHELQLTSSVHSVDECGIAVRGAVMGLRLRE